MSSSPLISAPPFQTVDSDSAFPSRSQHSSPRSPFIRLRRFQPCMSTTSNMSSPFDQLKKQASFFLKEKLRTARLAITDVTPAELLAEEATNGNPWAPDTRTMGFISRAAFEIDDYWRIIEVLHKRLEKFDRKQWRGAYQAMVLLEHLLTHGPESAATEFQCDREVIQQLGLIQYIDERGFNWGLAVKTKSDRVLELLENGQLLKEERERARMISRGIQGFGSFNHRSTSVVSELAVSNYRRGNSHYEPENQEDNLKPNSKSGEQEDNLKPNSKSGEQLIDVNLKTIQLKESEPLLAGQTT